MCVLKSGFFASSPRTNVIIVLYINVICYIITYLFYFRGILCLENNGFSLYLIILKSIWMLNILVPVIPIAKTPEKNVFWLKAFIFLKVVEVIGIPFHMVGITYLGINKIWEVLSHERLSEIHSNVTQDLQDRKLFDDSTNVVEFITYACIMLCVALLMLVMGIYFSFVVYSYLKEIERKDALNAHLSSVGQNLVAPEQFNVVYLPQPAYNPYMNTVPIVTNAV